MQAHADRDSLGPIGMEYDIIEGNAGGAAIS